MENWTLKKVPLIWMKVISTEVVDRRYCDQCDFDGTKLIKNKYFNDSIKNDSFKFS